jgi:uncharacterized protein (TIGR02145 family)
MKKIMIAAVLILSILLGHSTMFAQKADSLSCGTLKYEGQDYPTVKIGSQCWMSTNLNIGKWINAAQLQKISDSGIIEKYCYGNDFKQCDYWGGLYQWSELMRFSKDAGARGICPDGWHVPASKDWKTLIRFLGTDDDAGGRLKSTLQWERPNVGADNSSGFSAYPGGSLDYLSNKWYDLYRQGYYWTSEMISTTTAVGVNLTFRTGGINMYEEFQANALSVRCVKN